MNEVLSIDLEVSLRDGRPFVPQPETRIMIGDELLIVTTSRTREAAERDTLAHMATLPAWRDHPRVKAGSAS